MSPRRLGVIAFVLCAAVLVDWCSRLEFVRQGDGWEYLAVLEALDRHGSTDVRSGDLDAMFDHVDTWRLSASNGGSLPSMRNLADEELPYRFVTAADGRSYAAHFWLYSLFAYPAKLALRAVGGPEFNALAVTNAWLFALALGAVLFLAAGSVERRLALAGLLAITPVAWYVTFTGVEVFCWALVTLSLVCLDRRRYAASALAVGLAATQNPALAVLAAVPVALAVAERQWRVASLATLGGALAAWPLVYYGLRSGTPGLLARTNSDLGLVSWSRTTSLLVDLNAGLLPYVPVLLVAALLGTARLVARRDQRATLLALAGTALMLAVQAQGNWNSDGLGLQRYLVWMLPVLAWLAVEAWDGRARTWIVAASVVTSGLVLVLDAPSATSWLDHRAVARWAIQHAPNLYTPEFEVFAERSTHNEAPPIWMLQGRLDGWLTLLPAAYGRASGEVTTLLVDRDSAARLSERFRIDPSYLPALLQAVAASAQPIYVHPPPGTVWATPGSVGYFLASITSRPAI